MIENKEHIILVLQLINSNGNINFLIKLGYDFTKVAKFINFLRKNEYVDFQKGKLHLTNNGKAYLNVLNKELGKNGISRLISPLLQYKTEKLSKFDIYIPLDVK